MPALIGTVLALAAHAADDPRLITNGHLMHTWAYADQPYCVVFPREPEEDRPGRWLCTVTVNDNTHEGGAGEHVVSVYSDNRGVTWSEPLPLEPSLVPPAECPPPKNRSAAANRTACYVQVDNAYSNTLLTPAGRVYSVYNMNLRNVSTLHGKHIPRVDELGNFVMKYSDDRGESWSSEHLVVPYRTTDVDRNNSFNDHNVNASAGEAGTRIMWSVDQFKVRNGTAYFGFTKIGHYMQNPPQEGFFLASANILR
jgi:hypothetical protein